MRFIKLPRLQGLLLGNNMMESIMGYLSRRMLEHYSHVRLGAKQNALEALVSWKQKAAVDELVKGAVH